MGFWEPHSSSVDFCEPNYLLSEYIAEPHNVWSSLFITVIGMVGFFYGNPLNELSVSAMYIILAVIGLGSAGLHTTLHWFYQSSDEVPMLWQIPIDVLAYALHHKHIEEQEFFGTGLCFYRNCSVANSVVLSLPTDLRGLFGLDGCL